MRRYSSVSIATGYGLDGPGIESRLGRDFPHLSRPALGPTQPPVQWVPGLCRGKERPWRDADPSPPSSAVDHERVELYVSLYRPYGLYRASVPVQGCTLLLPLPHIILRDYCCRNGYMEAGIAMSIWWLSYWLAIRYLNPGRSTRYFPLSDRPYRHRSLSSLLFNGRRGLFPVVRRPGCEFDHLPPSSARVKDEQRYNLTSPIRVHGVVRRTFCFNPPNCCSLSEDIQQSCWQSLLTFYRRSADCFI
jgi:hypothetical protein